MKLSIDGKSATGSSFTINCDCLGISGGWTPAVHLFTQSGGKLKFDDDNLNYSKLDERTFIFDAKIGMNDFYKVIELNDPKEFEETKADSESLAGFLLEVAKEFPETGQQILFRKYKFIIESANKKGIKTVKITLP